MKFIIIAITFGLITGCNKFDALDSSLLDIEGSYLLESNHVSNTKTVKNPDALCDALILDDNNNPREVTGYVVSVDREIATLYMESDETGKFKPRIYTGKVEMDGQITRYENTKEDFVRLSRSSNGRLVLTFEDPSKNLVMDSVPLAEVEKMRSIIGNCKAQ